MNVLYLAILIAWIFLRAIREVKYVVQSFFFMETVSRVTSFLNRWCVRPSCIKSFCEPQKDRLGAIGSQPLAAAEHKDEICQKNEMEYGGSQKNEMEYGGSSSLYYGFPGVVSPGRPIPHNLFCGDSSERLVVELPTGFTIENH